MKGFGTILFLVLLPWLLAGTMLLISASLLIMHHSKTYYYCRSELLDLQKYLSYKLAQLLELNPKANSLRVEHDSALKALQVSTAIPSLFPAAKANYDSIVIRQIILQEKQLSLINQAKIEGNRKINEIKNRIEKDHDWFSDILGSKKNRLQLVASQSKLAIYPNPPTSLTPEYKQLPLFQRQQAIYVKWQLPFDEWWPQWIRNYINIPNIMSGQCSATLVKKGNRWKETLGEGK